MRGLSSRLFRSSKPAPKEESLSLNAQDASERLAGWLSQRSTPVHASLTSIVQDPILLQMAEYGWRLRPPLSTITNPDNNPPLLTAVQDAHEAVVLGDDYLSVSGETHGTVLRAALIVAVHDHLPESLRQSYIDLVAKNRCEWIEKEAHQAPRP